MAISKNIKVKEFLENLRQSDIDKYNTLETLREVVFKVDPDISERIMYGGIMFTLKELDFGGLFANKHHISFEFSSGVSFEDPNKLLEGTGKLRRHLKIKPNTNILNYDVEFFVEQAIQKVP